MFPHTATDAELVVDGDRLGYDVYRADSLLAKAVGVMGRRGLPDDTALAFPVADGTHTVHMVGVREPITVWWVRDGRLERSADLSAWTGHGSARADLILELPADAPAVPEGAAVRLEQQARLLDGRCTDSGGETAHD